MTTSVSNGACVTQCPNGQTVPTPAWNQPSLNGTCQPCPVQDGYAGNPNAPGCICAPGYFGDPDASNCVKTCPSGLNNGGTCVAKCPSGLNNNGTCVTTCPPQSPLVSPAGACMGCGPSNYGVQSQCLCTDAMYGEAGYTGCPCTADMYGNATYTACPCSPTMYGESGYAGCLCTSAMNSDSTYPNCLNTYVYQLGSYYGPSGNNMNVGCAVTDDGGALICSDGQPWNSDSPQVSEPLPTNCTASSNTVTCQSKSCTTSSTVTCQSKSPPEWSLTSRYCRAYGPCKSTVFITGPTLQS